MATVAYNTIFEGTREGFLEKERLREVIGGWKLNMLGVFEFTKAVQSLLE